MESISKREYRRQIMQKARSRSVSCPQSLVAHIAATRPTFVIGYLAMGGEPDIEALLRSELSRSTTVALVRIPEDSNFLELRAWDGSPSSLEHSIKLNVRQPKARCQLLHPEDFDVRKSVILVPGIAFDKQGWRLGRGQGWYDRFLARYPALIRIGVCADGRLVESVPREAHDQRMDYVATEEEILYFDRSLNP